MRDAVARLGNPADWLATDEPVARSLFRTIEVWYRDRWVDVGDVTEEALASWLAETA